MIFISKHDLKQIITICTKSERLTQKIVLLAVWGKKIFAMHKALSNYEISLLVIQVQQPIWKILKFVVHITHTCKVVIEKITVGEWVKRSEQNSLDGYTPA